MVAHPFWRDKCVIVSGASSGIGRAVAELAAQRGGKVGLLARRQDRLEAAVTAIRSASGTAELAVADVTDAAQTQAAIQQLEQALGPCQVLVANAGIYRQTDATTFSAAAARDVLQVNTMGVVNLIGAVLPGMVERKSGAICGVASIAAMLGLPGSGAYCASKAAVVTLLESLRVELHDVGIRVTAVCPGFVDTPLITDDDRHRELIISAEDAARRICWAVERGKAEYWFPWRTWLAARVGRALPHSWYRWVIRRRPPMEEAE